MLDGSTVTIKHMGNTYDLNPNFIMFHHESEDENEKTGILDSILVITCDGKPVTHDEAKAFVKTHGKVKAKHHHRINDKPVAIREAHAHIAEHGPVSDNHRHHVDLTSA